MVDFNVEGPGFEFRFNPVNFSKKACAFSMLNRRVLYVECNGSIASLDLPGNKNTFNTKIKSLIYTAKERQ